VEVDWLSDIEVIGNLLLLFEDESVITTVV